MEPKMRDDNAALFEHPELRALQSFGVTTEAMGKFQVLCLPENVREASSRGELVDAGNALDLAKLLKEAGVSTATSYDLTPEAKTIERRGGDWWFGVVWVLGNVALPFFISVLANMVTGWRESKGKSKAPTAHIKLRLKRGENVVNIDYSGDGDTLVDVLNALKRDRENEK